MVLADVVVAVIGVDDGQREARDDPGVPFRREELHVQEPQALDQWGQEEALDLDHEPQGHRDRAAEYDQSVVRHFLDRVAVALFHRLDHVPVLVPLRVAALVPIQEEAVAVSHPEPGIASTMKMVVCVRKLRSSDGKQIRE